MDIIVVFVLFGFGVGGPILVLEGEGLAVVAVHNAVLEAVASGESAAIVCTRAAVAHVGVGAGILAVDPDGGVLVLVVVVTRKSEDDFSGRDSSQQRGDENGVELHLE